MEMILSVEEHELLLSILEQRHRELWKEIRHTDSRDFKELLRRHEKLLDAMLGRLQIATGQGVR